MRGSFVAAQTAAFSGGGAKKTNRPLCPPSACAQMLSLASASFAFQAPVVHFSAPAATRAAAPVATVFDDGMSQFAAATYATGSQQQQPLAGSSEPTRRRAMRPSLAPAPAWQPELPACTPPSFC